MFGGFEQIGQLGGNSGPAISGGSPVFQIASEQPSFLNDAPFFAARPSFAGGNMVPLVLGAVVIAGVAYVAGKKL